MYGVTNIKDSLKEDVRANRKNNNEQIQKDFPRNLPHKFEVSDEGQSFEPKDVQNILNKINRLSHRNESKTQLSNLARMLHFVDLHDRASNGIFKYAKMNLIKTS